MVIKGDWGDSRVKVGGWSVAITETFQLNIASLLALSVTLAVTVCSPKAKVWLSLTPITAALALLTHQVTWVLISPSSSSSARTEKSSIVSVVIKGDWGDSRVKIGGWSVAITETFQLNIASLLALSVTLAVTVYSPNAKVWLKLPPITAVLTLLTHQVTCVLISPSSLSSARTEKSSIVSVVIKGVWGDNRVKVGSWLEGNDE